MTVGQKRSEGRPAAPLVYPAVRDKAADDQFNDEMARIMTAAADLRAERTRIRSAEDERLARGETAAIQALIRSRAGDAGDARDRDPQPGAQEVAEQKS